MADLARPIYVDGNEVIVSESVYYLKLANGTYVQLGRLPGSSVIECGSCSSIKELIDLIRHNSDKIARFANGVNDETCNMQSVIQKPSAVAGLGHAACMIIRISNSVFQIFEYPSASNGEIDHVYTRLLVVTKRTDDGYLYVLSDWVKYDTYDLWALKDQYEKRFTAASITNCNTCSTINELWEAVNATDTKTGIGEIGAQQSNNLKTLLGDPGIGNYVYVHIRAVGDNLLHCVATSANAKSNVKYKYIYRALYATTDTARQGQTAWQTLTVS